MCIQVKLHNVSDTIARDDTKPNIVASVFKGITCGSSSCTRDSKTDSSVIQHNSGLFSNMLIGDGFGRIHDARFISE